LSNPPTFFSGISTPGKRKCVSSQTQVRFDQNAKAFQVKRKYVSGQTQRRFPSNTKAFIFQPFYFFVNPITKKFHPFDKSKITLNFAPIYEPFYQSLHKRMGLVTAKRTQKGRKSIIHNRIETIRISR